MFKDNQGQETGAIYPHRLLMDVICETGVGGLMGFLGFFVLLRFIPNSGALAVPARFMAWLLPLSTYATVFYKHILGACAPATTRVSP